MTPRQVRWAREQYRSGKRSTHAIASRLGVSQTAVSFMLNGKTYTNVK